MSSKLVKRTIRTMKGSEGKCDACGHQTELIVHGDWDLCFTCDQIVDPIIEQMVEVNQAKYGSTKEIDGDEVVWSATQGSKYDQNSLAIQIGDVALYRISADEVTKLLKKNKFRAVKAKKYYWLEVIDEKRQVGKAVRS